MRRLNLRNLCIVATAVLFAGLLFAAPASATPPTVTASASPDAGPWTLPFQFSATAVDPDGGAIVRYHWYFADGSTSEEQNPVHTYTCYGVFQVLVTVYDDQGEMGTAALTVNANQVVYSSAITLNPVVKYSKGRVQSGTVWGSVVVRDTDGYPISGALVQATWTTPTGTATQTATTDVSGVAGFSVGVPRGASGTYTLTVTDVSGTDLFFDPTHSTLSASVGL